MKKVISLLLVVIMAISAFSVANFSATTTKTVTKKNANYRYTISGNKVEIKKYIGKSTSVSIPSKIENKRVTTIGRKAFYGNNKLKSVKIPSTVDTILGMSFDSCVKLEKVVIPNSVKKLGNAVFFSCTRLKSVTLSKNLESIGKACFYNCSKLKSITLPNTLRNVGAYVFGNCTSLNSVVINNGPTYISREMFLNCYKLKKVSLPKSVTKISRKAFSDCSELSEINITDRITSIGSKAFNDCRSLKEMYVNTKNIYDSTFYSCNLNKLTLGNNVQNINANAFQLISIDTLNIPSSVTNISSSAFTSSKIKNLNIDKNNPKYVSMDNVIYTKDMKKILVTVQYDSDKDYSIPSGVQEIGEKAFTSTEYTGITIPDTVTKIGKNAFADCQNLEKVYIPDSVTDIEEGAFSGCFQISDLHISENITVLNKNVFNDCSGVKNLTIPETVTKIYSGALGGYSKETFNVTKNVTGISSTAFGQINKIKNFTVDSENKFYTTVDGILYSRDKKIMKLYPQGRKDKSVTIPTGTEEIGSKSLYAGESIKNISVPSTVKKMDDYAIFFMPKIQTITVPSSVKTIGKCAMGYGNGDYGISMISYDLAIIGSKNSQANKYAKENSISFFTGSPRQNVTAKSIAGGKSFTVKVANINQSDLTFSSSNNKIATVDKNGKVTGIRKGTTNIIATSITKNFTYKITVTSNAKNKPKTFDDSSYYKFTAKNYKTWTKDYYKFNNKIKYSGIDNPNIQCYTSNDYIFLHALAGSKKYIKKAQERVGSDYDQYIYFLYGTNMELSRFKLHRNTVFYRGSADVSNITGTSYTLKDMKASIGRTYTDKTLVSTSIDHGVAGNFYNQEKGAVLEIYAPKNVTVGGYIEKMSEFATEREFLLASNTKFKVIDAGVRKVTYDNIGNEEKETQTERFMKLLIVK